MRPVFPFGRFSVVALAAAFLAGCATGPTEAEKEAARVAYDAAVIAAQAPPPINLNQSVVQAAAVYMAFSRDMAAIEGGFTSPEQIQAALRRGASYDPGQISRGLVAYASIIALQSPEFVAGVRSMAEDRSTREKLVADIVADPAYASSLPGAGAATGPVITTHGAVNSAPHRPPRPTPKAPPSTGPRARSRMTPTPSRPVTIRVGPGASPRSATASAGSRPPRLAPPRSCDRRQRKPLACSRPPTAAAAHCPSAASRASRPTRRRSSTLSPSRPWPPSATRERTRGPTPTPCSSIGSAMAVSPCRS